MRRASLGSVLVIAAVVGVGAVAGCGSGANSGKSTAVTDGSGMVTMPVLAGQNAVTARDELEKLGFPRSGIKLRADDGQHTFVVVDSHWVVNTQSVEAGARVSVRKVIVLGVGKTTWRQRHHHLL